LFAAPPFWIVHLMSKLTLCRCWSFQLRHVDISGFGFCGYVYVWNIMYFCQIEVFRILISCRTSSLLVGQLAVGLGLRVLLTNSHATFISENPKSFILADQKKLLNNSNV
jgi:hypothetical protein